MSDMEMGAPGGGAEPSALFDAPEDSDLSAVMRQNAMLAWLYAEAVWHHGQTLEDYQRNDEQVLAENQRLADENALLREELDKVSGGWEARVASRAALIAERDTLRAQVELARRAAASGRGETA